MVSGSRLGFGASGRRLLRALVCLIAITASDLSRSQVSGVDAPAMPALDFSTEDAAWLQGPPDIVLALVDDQPPLSSVGAEGILEGAIPEIFARLTAILGHSVALLPAASDAFHEVARQEGVHGLATVFDTGTNRRDYLLTQPFMQTPFYIMAGRDQLHRYRRAEDLAGKRIIVPRGHRGFISWLTRVPEVEISYADNPIIQMQRVLDGHADALIGYMNYPQLAEKYLMGELDVAFVARQAANVHIGINPGQAPLRAILNRAIERLDQEQTSAILNAWARRTFDPDVGQLSSEEDHWLERRHRVRVRIADNPPWEFNDPEPRGMAVDYLRRIAELFDIEFSFVASDDHLANALADLASSQDRYDLIPILTGESDPFPALIRSRSYLTAPTALFTRNDQEPVFGIDDLAGKRVAVLQDSDALIGFSDTGIPGKLQLEGSPRTALRALAVGEVDAYVGNLLVASHVMQREGIANVGVAAPGPFGDVNASMAIRPDWGPLASLIDKGLTAIPAAEHAAIASRYAVIRYDYGVDPKRIAFWVSIVLVPTLLLLIALAARSRYVMRIARERKQLTISLAQQREILDTIDHLQSLFIEYTDTQAVFDEMLLKLLDLTGSQCGFIDSLEADADGKPFLEALAISNVAWSAETRARYARMAPSGLRFYDVDRRFGPAVSRREVVIANARVDAAPFEAAPGNHPPIDTFLAVPLKHESEVIGVIGLANNEQGYTEELVARLESVWGACGQLVYAHKQRRDRQAARDELEKRNEDLSRAISQLRTATRQRDEAAAVYEALFEQSNPIGVCDLQNGRFIQANEKFCLLVERSNDDILGSTLQQMGFEDMDEKLDDRLREVRIDGTSSFEVKLRAGRQRSKDILVTAWKVRIKDQELLQALFLDITERKAMERKLEFQATHDALTGVLNRGTLERAVSREYDRSKRYRHDLCLLMCDLDHFKQVNDEHGHQVGDQVLVAFTDCLREQLRNVDFVGRYGGEEFLMVLPETTLEEALECAERIRASVEALRVDAEQRSISVTVSIGVAPLADSGLSADRLISAADDALYHAKASGRNCVRAARARGQLRAG